MNTNAMKTKFTLTILVILNTTLLAKELTIVFDWAFEGARTLRSLY